MADQQDLLHHLALVGRAIEQNIVAREDATAIVQPLAPDARGEAMGIAVAADIFERVAERPRIAHDRSQRPEHPPALQRRQPHSEVGAGERFGGMFDQVDHLAIGDARAPLAHVPGRQSGVGKQRIGRTAEFSHQIGEKAQDSSVHHVEDFGAFRRVLACSPDHLSAL